MEESEIKTKKKEKKNASTVDYADNIKNFGSHTNLQKNE